MHGVGGLGGGNRSRTYIPRSLRIPRRRVADVADDAKFESRRAKRHGKYARRGSAIETIEWNGRRLRANDRLDSVAIVSASVTERRRESFKHDAVARARA